MLKVLFALALIASACCAPLSFSLGSQEDFLRVQSQVIRQNILGVINWPYTTCGTGTSIKTAFVQMAAKPALGQGVDISVIGKNMAEFDLTKVGINVYYKGIFLINVDGSVNLPHHYTVGTPLIYRYKVDIPTYAFHGDYRIQMQFNDNDKELLCVEIKMTL